MAGGAAGACGSGLCQPGRAALRRGGAVGSAGWFPSDWVEAEESPPAMRGRGFLWRSEGIPFRKEERVAWEAYLTAGREIGAEIK